MKQTFRVFKNDSKLSLVTKNFPNKRTLSKTVSHTEKKIKLICYEEGLFATIRCHICGYLGPLQGCTNVAKSLFDNCQTNFSISTNLGIFSQLISGFLVPINLNVTQYPTEYFQQ